MSDTTQGTRAEVFCVADRTDLVPCGCRGSLVVGLNYASGDLPLLVSYHHELGCGSYLMPWIDGEIHSAAELMRRVIPPETAASMAERLTTLVDKGECDARCLFAEPSTDRSCDCPCEGIYHGLMRWESTRAESAPPVPED